MCPHARLCSCLYVPVPQVREAAAPFAAEPRGTSLPVRTAAAVSSAALRRASRWVGVVRGRSGINETNGRLAGNKRLPWPAIPMC